MDEQGITVGTYHHLGQASNEALNDIHNYIGAEFKSGGCTKTQYHMFTAVAHELDRRVYGESYNHESLPPVETDGEQVLQCGSLKVETAPTKSALDYLTAHHNIRHRLRALADDNGIDGRVPHSVLRDIQQLGRDVEDLVADDNF